MCWASFKSSSTVGSVTTVYGVVSWKAKPCVSSTFSIAELCREKRETIVTVNTRTRKRISFKGIRTQITKQFHFLCVKTRDEKEFFIEIQKQRKKKKEKRRKSCKRNIISSRKSRFVVECWEQKEKHSHSCVENQRKVLARQHHDNRKNFV